MHGAFSLKGDLMAKSIEYKGHTVMSGSRLFELLTDTKDPDASQKANKHFQEVLANHKKLVERSCPPPPASTTASPPAIVRA
jgi:hypothetical protein